MNSTREKSAGLCLEEVLHEFWLLKKKHLPFSLRRLVIKGAKVELEPWEGKWQAEIMVTSTVCKTLSNCVALFAMGRCDILALGPFLDIVPLKSMQARWWLWRGAIRTVRALKNVLGWQIELCWFSLKRKLWSWNEKRAVFKVSKRLVQKERKQYILQYPLKIRQEKNTFCCKREDVH